MIGQNASSPTTTRQETMEIDSDSICIYNGADVKVMQSVLQLIADSDNHAVYQFCGKRRDRIKVLLRELDGNVLLYKRLDVVQGRSRWSRNSVEVKPIVWQQFDWLMSGLDIEQPKVLKTAQECKNLL